MLMLGALSHHTMNSLLASSDNEWSDGVSNKEDLHVEHYWNYLAKTMERAGNLLDMQQMLREKYLYSDSIVTYAASLHTVGQVG